MEALKQALLALTRNVYNFTAAPGTAPPYLVWQVDGGNDLSAGNGHAETAAVMGKREKQVADLIYRGKIALRKRLEQEGITDAYNG